MKSYWTFSSKEDIGNVVFFLYQLEENFVCLNRTHDHYTWLIASKIWFVVNWNIHLLVFIFYLLDFLILVNDGRNVSSWSHDRYSYLLTNTQVSKSLVSIAFSYWTFLSSAAMMGQYLFFLLFFLVLRLNDGNVFLFVLPLLVLLGHTSGVAGTGRGNKNIKKKNSLHFFFVLKLSETYAKTILPSAFFKGRGVCRSFSRKCPITVSD